MKHVIRSIAAAVVAAIATGGIAVAPAGAHGYRVGTITIGHFWATPAKAGTGATGVYGILYNTGKAPDRLVGATTPVAGQVRFRAKTPDGFKWLDGIPLAPGRPMAIAAWRQHLWLTGLKRPLAAGTSFPLTLSFRRAGRITIRIVVGREGRH
jgi:copper(I)-binding protein